MQSRFYEIQSEDVYIGRVVKVISGIYRYEHMGKNGLESSISVVNYVPCRSILFIPNEQKHAEDLLYDVPNYPIFNISLEEECLNLSSKAIVVKNACCLGPLLHFAGFNLTITHKEIIAIKRIIFSRKTTDNKSLIKLCALNDLYYERDYGLLEDFLNSMEDYFGSREEAIKYYTRLKDFISKKNIFQPNLLKEPEIKRLNFLPTRK